MYGGECSVIMLTLNTLNKIGIMKYFEKMEGNGTLTCSCL